MTKPPDSIGFVYEQTMLRITGVKRSTWQNWEKATILDSPIDGRFGEAEVVEVAVVLEMVGVLKGLADAATAWRGERAAVLEALLAGPDTPDVHLLIEPRLLHVVLVSAQTPVTDALRPGEATVAVALGESVRALRKDFWRFVTHDRTAEDRRRKDSRGRRRGAKSSRRAG